MSRAGAAVASIRELRTANPLDRPVADGDVDGKREICERGGSDDEVEHGIEAAMILEILGCGHGRILRFRQRGNGNFFELGLALRAKGNGCGVLGFILGRRAGVGRR